MFDISIQLRTSTPQIEEVDNPWGGIDCSGGAVPTEFLESTMIVI
jgi:hypothetical protein